MLESRLTELFKEHSLRVQRVLTEVLRLEQQYITDPLRTNSSALREIRQKIDRIIQDVCKDEGE